MILMLITLPNFLKTRLELEELDRGLQPLQRRGPRGSSRPREARSYRPLVLLLLKRSHGVPDFLVRRGRGRNRTRRR